MQAPTILIAGVRSSTEARLRSAFQEVEFVPFSGGATRGAARTGVTSAAIVNLDGDHEQGFRLVRELSGGRHARGRARARRRTRT